MRPSALQVLARLHGIQGGYRDAWGAWRVADPEALRAVLRAMGIAPGDLEHPEQGIRHFARERMHAGFPPVAAVWEGHAANLDFGVPEDASGYYRGHVSLETGEDLAMEGRLEALPVAERRQVDGRIWLRRRLPLPEGIPWGYHRVHFEGHGRKDETLLISSPYRAAGLPGDPARPRWGAFLPLYALRSASDWGAGDFGDLEKLRAWAGEHGFQAVGTLPLLPAFLEHPFNPSPYAPVSRCFWNEFYVDPRRAPEFEASPAARELADAPSFRQAIDVLRGREKVDYAGIWALKRPVLEALADGLRADPERWRRRTEAFVRRRPEVKAYARFRALQDRSGGRPWTEWPVADLDRGADTTPDDSRTADFYLYVQLLAHEQMDAAGHRSSGRAASLYLDLPLGSHPDGFDSWYYRESFVPGVSVGAPPDPIFTGGQDWGFAPFHPGRIRRLGYTCFIEGLRHHLSQAGILRIDHAMCFHRLFWVPPGLGAKRGVYVRYPAADFYAILTLESRRHHAALVGEDLGTVPEQVRRFMERHGFSRTYAMQLELRPDPDHAMGEVPDQAVACVNTHDLSPFAAYWAGEDIHQRFALGLITESVRDDELRDREAIRNALILYLRARGALAPDADAPLDVLLACLATMGRSPAGLTLINLEDLWQEHRRQNLPGTTVEHPNWLHRARHGLDEFDGLEGVHRLLREIPLRPAAPTG